MPATEPRSILKEHLFTPDALLPQLSLNSFQYIFVDEGGSWQKTTEFDESWVKYYNDGYCLLFRVSSTGNITVPDWNNYDVMDDGDDQLWDGKSWVDQEKG